MIISFKKFHIDKSLAANKAVQVTARAGALL